jgi:hypothetical protein
MMKTCALIFCLLWNTFLHGQEKQKVLSVEQMHADLKILKSAFISLHPGIYSYNTRAQFDRYFTEITRQTSRPILLKNFYIKLSQLTTKLKCGHTYLNPYNQKKALSAQLFSGNVIPILFKVIQKKLIITHNLSEQAKLKPGDEIVSINGKPAADIIDSLLTVSRSDGKNGLNKKLDNISVLPYMTNQEKYTLFDIYFPMFFPDETSSTYCEIGIKPYNEHKLVPYQISKISKHIRQQRLQDRFAEASNPPTTTFNWVSAQYGYLKIRNFNTEGWGDNYVHYLDSIFIKLKTTRVANLIVDIRDNEGGDDEVRNKIISYLITDSAPYAMRRYFQFLTVPDSLMPYLKTWDPLFKEPKSASNYQETETGLYFDKNYKSNESIVPNKNHFMGSTYLITNATNSSGSFFMADILQENKYAKLVGEPTGGTKQGINGGQFFF